MKGRVPVDLWPDTMIDSLLLIAFSTYCACSSVMNFESTNLLIIGFILIPPVKFIYLCYNTFTKNNKVFYKKISTGASRHPFDFGATGGTRTTDQALGASVGDSVPSWRTSFLGPVTPEDVVRCLPENFKSRQLYPGEVLPWNPSIGGSSISQLSSNTKHLPQGEVFCVGATGGTRTPDLLITNQLLYHLSHSSIWNR